MKKSRKSKLIKENDEMWSVLVRNRFNYTCAMCDDGVRKPVSAHHIFGRSNKATRWEVDNGVALCYYHHRFCIHGGRCSPEEILVFYKRILGEKRYKELKEMAKKPVKFNLAFVIDYNVRLRNQIQETFGVSWEEYKKLKKGR